MIVAVLRDLILFSRIEAASRRAGSAVTRVDAPSSVPAGAGLVLVDWSDREPGWTRALRTLSRSGATVVLFGPHTDLEAHAAARAAGLGPMIARSKLLADLPSLVEPFT
jgi:hypothetical protein